MFFLHFFKDAWHVHFDLSLYLGQSCIAVLNSAVMTFCFPECRFVYDRVPVISCVIESHGILFFVFLYCGIRITEVNFVASNLVIDIVSGTIFV